MKKTAMGMISFLIMLLLIGCAEEDARPRPTVPVSATSASIPTDAPTPTPTATLTPTPTPPPTATLTPTPTPPQGEAIPLTSVMSNYYRILKTTGYSSVTLQGEQRKYERKYNSDGQLLEERSYENDALISIQKNEYYDNGVKSLDSYERVSGEYAHTSSRYYNRDGLVVLSVYESEDYYLETEYILDEQGRYREVTCKEGKNGKKYRQEEYIYENNKTTLLYYSGKNGVVDGKRIWIYDDMGRLLSEKLYDEKGTYLHEGNDYSYEGDYLVYWCCAGGDEGFTQYYKYDGEGKLIQCHDGSIDHGYYTYEYEGNQLVRLTYEDVADKLLVYTWKDGKRIEYMLDKESNVETKQVYLVGTEPYVKLNGNKNVVMDKGFLIETSSGIRGTDTPDIHYESEWDPYQTTLTVNEYTSPKDAKNPIAFYISTVYTFDASGYLLKVQVLWKNEYRIKETWETTTYQWDIEA